jgi:hypothetical protein
MIGTIGLLCVLVGGCGSATKRAPTQRDISAISAAMSDIVYQCQAVAAGYVASADTGSLRRDVDALLASYRNVRPDARFVLGGGSEVTVHTTLRQELAVAAGNLEDAGCFPAQARRIAAAVGSH